MAPGGTLRGSGRQLPAGSIDRDGPVVVVSNITALPCRMIARCIADTPEFSLRTVHQPANPPALSTGSTTLSRNAPVGADRSGTLKSPGCWPCTAQTAARATSTATRRRGAIVRSEKMPLILPYSYNLPGEWSGAPSLSCATIVSRAYNSRVHVPCLGRETREARGTHVQI
jgi:hypothetical protein